MAANASDVLDAATLSPSLDAALSDTTLQIAFTTRSRALSHASMPVREAAMLAARTLAAGPVVQIALVFGNESYGLSNEEVMRCNRTAYIPTGPEASSLNLAAAVQVAAYELWLAAVDEKAAIATRTGRSAVPEAAAATAAHLARHEDVERFFEHLEQSLYRSGFLQPGNPRRLMERMRRLYARSGLEPEEVKVLRGMLSAWDGTGGRHGT